MAQETLEWLRRSYDAFNARDLEAWMGAFDPEITWQAAREDPDASLHVGRDGIRKYAEQWIEAWDDLRAEPLEIIEKGGCIVVWVRLTGRGRTSGLPLDMEQAQVMTLRDGMVLSVHEYFDRAEALQAAAQSG